MINRIPCKCLLISSLSGLTRKRGMARASLAIPTRFLVAPDKLDIKRHKLGILYILKATPSIGLEPDTASVFKIYNIKFMFHSPWSLTGHFP